MSEMDRDIPPFGEQMRLLAKLWMQAQTPVAAYIWANITVYQDAEDLLQQVAESAAEHFARYDPARPFLPWVMGITRHKVNDYFRSRSRDRLVYSEKALEMLADACCELEEDMVARKDALQRCVAKLGDKPRRVLDMRYTEDLKPAAIADRLGTTSNTISVYLSRARAALAQCIRKQLASEERS